uniref:Uncharacterized protein n=1 Tax=Moschus moschiferus TaxID=68415 RepID=A0A8C6DTQ8_MOSMO
MFVVRCFRKTRSNTIVAIPREISTKGKSVDSSLRGLSRSSKVANLDTSSTKTSEQSNNNSDTCADLFKKYIDAIEKLKLSEGKSLEGPLELINYIDVTQKDKKFVLAWRIPGTREPGGLPSRGSHRVGHN